jgi:hypothetical protein
MYTRHTGLLIMKNKKIIDKLKKNQKRYFDLKNRRLKESTCCRYTLKKHDTYNTFNVSPSMSVMDNRECRDKSGGRDIIYVQDEILENHYILLNTIENIKAIACVHKKKWLPNINSTAKEENIITIEISDSNNAQLSCEQCGIQGGISTPQKNPLGVEIESTNLYIIASDNEFNPQNFIDDYSENNEFINSDGLNSSGYGTHVSATRQELSDFGEFGKNYFYKSCDKTTPCCDNCYSYPKGFCISTPKCRWENENNVKVLNCTHDSFCFDRLIDISNKFPSEFYISNLDTSQKQTWNSIVKNKKTSNNQNTSRKKLFVTELHRCMWFDCNSNSPNSPCKKYNEC